jgi:hypothetical protein
MGIQIRFTWVPVHVGVEGNETVDVLAKQSLSSGDVEVVVSMSKAEAKSLIWTVMVLRWQEQCNRDSEGEHLFQVQREVVEGRTAGRDKRGCYFYKFKDGTQPVE